MGATTIAGMHVNRGSRAGSSLGNGTVLRAGSHLPLQPLKKNKLEAVCHEADQRLRNAKRNKPGNRDNGTKRSAGASENKKNPPKAASMRWPNYTNTRRLRPLYLILVRKNHDLVRKPPLAAKTKSNHKPHEVSVARSA